MVAQYDKTNIKFSEPDFCNYSIEVEYPFRSFYIDLWL